MAVQKAPVEAYVGIFATIAILLLAYGWSWLHSFSLFHPPQKFTIKFHDVAGLNNNAPVNVARVRVGNVEKLNLVKKGEVQVVVKINTEQVTIPEGSVFTIQTLGLVGAKYLEITLPELKDSEQPPPIAADAIETGQDPPRIELVMNKVATNLSHIDFAGVEGTMSKNLERVAAAADSVQEVAQKYADVASDAKGAAQNANKFFARGTKSMDNVDALAVNSKTAASHITELSTAWTTTSHKLNRILDDPNIISNLRATMEQVQQTSKNIQATADRISTTLQNDKMRGDLITALENLNKSTDNVYGSLKIVSSLAGDQGLRSDLKTIVSNASNTMDKVNNLVAEPAFGTDLKSAIDNVNSAAQNLDTVSLQMQQILDQKRPLMKMLFSRPGHLTKKPKTEMNVKGSGVDTASKSGATAPSDKSAPPPSGGTQPQEPAPVAPTMTPPNTSTTPE